MVTTDYLLSAKQVVDNWQQDRDKLHLREGEQLLSWIGFDHALTEYQGVEYIIRSGESKWMGMTREKFNQFWKDFGSEGDDDKRLGDYKISGGEDQ